MDSRWVLHFDMDAFFASMSSNSPGPPGGAAPTGRRADVTA
ncbi:MAG TPA: hypothetical protein VMB04_05175 [Mycobacterium sp.]|nr:hypothetical protein [Mycobacterium sp.]